MKQIYFITGNYAKVAYAKSILNDFGIQVIQKKLELVESRDEDPIQVVKDKAMQSIKVFSQPLIVEDSGIFINALNGFPKTYVQFCVSTIGIKGILKLMKNIKDRSAEFRSSLAYIDSPNKEPIIFNEIDNGFSIANKVWKKDGLTFGEIDRILIPPGESKANSTFSEEWRTQRNRKRKTQTHFYKFARWYSELK